MADVKQGRWTASVDGDFVVFLIGARIDWRHPVRTLNDLGGMKGMPYMLKHLSTRPESGLMGFQTYGLTMNVQYWRSFEDLERFANAPDQPHRPAWRNYWKRVGRDPRSGIWHETFLVRADEYEAVYGNMPPHGLGRATSLVSLREGSTARRRLKRTAGAGQSGSGSEHA
jgi:Monooxygenase af470-like